MTTYLLRINNIEKQTIQKQGLMNVEFPCLILIIISPPFWGGGGGYIIFFLSFCLSQKFVHTTSTFKREFLKTLHACLLHIITTFLLDPL
jgi:hypothetical protein